MNETESRDILIADDQPMNLSVLSGMLRERGHRVRAVTNGRKAVDAARAQIPDLIMLDITMPELDGYEACRELKSDPALAGVPVIFISAHDQPLDKVRAFQAGGADYVPKPFHVEEVMARVEHQLSILALRRDLLARNAALLEANLKLRELDSLKASFTAMLVHDLRSPLGAVNLVIQETLDTGQVDERMLSMCTTHIDKALKFLNDLMEVFRAEAQEMVLEEDLVDCKALLEALLESFGPRAGQLEIQLAVQAEPGLPLLHGDLAKLERVFANLVGNALKFTGTGGSVSIRAEPVEGIGIETGTRWIQVAVQDTGRGIPADRLPFVFDPYHQALKSDSFTGTGLGLAIVARIVAAHGGRVQVRSREGVGSCFSVLLPIRASERPGTGC